MATDTDRIIMLSDRVPSFRYDSLSSVFSDVIDNDLEIIDAEELAKYAVDFSQSQVWSSESIDSRLEI